MNAMTELSYDPNRLLDSVIHMLNLRNDAALARTLGIDHPVISSIRHGRLALGAVVLVAIHEETGLGTKELRRLMGDRRRMFRGTTVHSPHAERRAT